MYNKREREEKTRGREKGRDREKNEDKIKKKRNEGREKVRSHHLKSVLNQMSPVKVKFYESNCASTSCLYTGVDRSIVKQGKRRGKRATMMIKTTKKKEENGEISIE